MWFPAVGGDMAKQTLKWGSLPLEKSCSAWSRNKNSKTRKEPFFMARKGKDLVPLKLWGKGERETTNVGGVRKSIKKQAHLIRGHTQRGKKKIQKKKKKPPKKAK